MSIGLGGRSERLYRFFQWPVRLAGLNLLWILGVLAGLIVAGIAPATQAMYAVIGRYLRDEPVRLWADFWRAWRRGMRSSQLVLGVPLLTAVVVAFYLVASRATPFVFVTTVIAIGYLGALIQLPAAADRLDLRATKLWKASTAIAWRQPLISLGVVLGVVVMVTSAWFIAPLAVPLYFPVLPASLGSLVVNRGIRRFAGPEVLYQGS